MFTNKDTVKAVNAARTLVKYCARYKNCDNCIFHTEFGHCVVNMPFNFDLEQRAQKGG